MLLCVMLIGRFPFEGTEMSTATNLDEVSTHVSELAAFLLSLCVERGEREERRERERERGEKRERERERAERERELF